MATALLILIYLAFIGLGLPDSLLGAAWPVAHIDLGVGVPAAGLVAIVGSVGTVASSLLSARLIRRYGTGLVTAISVMLTAAALLGMAFVQSYYVVLLLGIPLGFGAGSVDSGLNNFVAIHYKASHMNWLHCFWGVGTTMSPLIMSFFLARGNWHGGYGAVSAALCGISLTLFAALPLWRRVGGVGTVPGAAADADVVVSYRALLNRPGAVASCAAFLLYCGAEFVTGLWSSTYFVTMRGVAPETAASWASLFYFGIMAGRLLSGFAAMKLSDRALIRIGEGVAIAGLVVLLLPLSNVFQVAGLALVGLGCAPLFPSMLDETPELFGKRYSQGLMGLQFAGAYIGGTLLPPLFGWLSPVIGLRAWPVYLLILMAALTLVTEQKQRACARKESA